MNALSSSEACHDFMTAFMIAQRDAVVSPPSRTKEYVKRCKEVLNYIDDLIGEAADHAAKLDVEVQTPSKLRS